MGVLMYLPTSFNLTDYPYKNPVDGSNIYDYTGVDNPYWLVQNSPATSSFFTLFTGGLMLPLAWLFSRVMKTTWTIATNPLQPLGLWLNFAQLFYFPILVFVYAKQPQHFIMTYAIITGAHFFPYAWFYNVRAYAVMAGVIAVGSMLIGWRVSAKELYFVPVFVVC